MEPRNIRTACWDPQKAGGYLKERKLDVVYGPINSRRLGLSLGINPIQSVGENTLPFACNWSCVYCQYGADGLDESVKKGRIRFATLEEIKAGLEERLSSNEHYDSVTICGPTEPTISPYFDDIVNLAVEMRDRYRPEIKTSLFTNATKLRSRNVLPLDYVFMKLDAGNEKTFKRFNRPRGVKFDDLVDELKSADVKRRIIQTAVIGGKDGNIEDLENGSYVKVINEINPDEIHLYPLLYRPFPRFDLSAISREKLESLGEYIRNSTDSQVKTFFNPVNIGEEFRF